MMSETDPEYASPSEQLDTSDDIGTVQDLNISDNSEEQEEKKVSHNESTDVIVSESELVEEELDVNDDIPDIKSKLSFQEDAEVDHIKKQDVESNPSNGSTEPDADSRNSMSRRFIEEPKPVKVPLKPVEIKPVHIGDQKLRSKLKFVVVTAKVVEEQGKKHVTYTIMMKRAGGEVQPAVICRRYNDFCHLYERILCTFHPSILGDFQFPKKSVFRNFKAEIITERTDAFHKFLNLIATSDKLLYSDYFHAFLCSDEQNEAVSYIKLGKYEEAAPLLETIFYIREKLVTISHVSVLECLVELVACLEATQAEEPAFRYALVTGQSMALLAGHPMVDTLRVPFLKLASQLAVRLGHDPKPYNKQLSELRYSGVKTDNTMSLLEVIRDKYIHTATRTAKSW